MLMRLFEDDLTRSHERCKHECTLHRGRRRDNAASCLVNFFINIITRQEDTSS